MRQNPGESLHEPREFSRTLIRPAALSRRQFIQFDAQLTSVAEIPEMFCRFHQSAVDQFFGLVLSALLTVFPVATRASSPTIDGSFGGTVASFIAGRPMDRPREVASAGAGGIWVHEDGRGPEAGHVSVALIVPLSLKGDTYGFTRAIDSGHDLTAWRRFQESTRSEKDADQFFNFELTTEDNRPGRAPDEVLSAASSMCATFDVFGIGSDSFRTVADGLTGAPVDLVFRDFEGKEAANADSGFRDLSEILLTEVHLSPATARESESSDDAAAPTDVPEPAGLCLFSIGLLCVFVYRSRWKPPILDSMTA